MKSVVVLFALILAGCGGGDRTSYAYVEVGSANDAGYDPFSYGIDEGFIVINELDIPVIQVAIDGVFYDTTVVPGSPLVVEFPIVVGRLYDILFRFSNGKMSVVHFVAPYAAPFLIVVPASVLGGPVGPISSD